MRWIFLAVGFFIGFGCLYFTMKEKAPQILAATPGLATAPVATAVNDSDATSQMPAPPPVDPAEVQTLQNRLKNNPRDYDALVEMGNIDYDQRNFAEAASYYTKALDVNSSDINVRTDLGTVLLYLQRWDDAEAQFQKSLAMNPTHPQTLFNMGVLLLHGKNDPQGALKVWQKLIDTNPDFPQISLVKEQIEALKAAQKQK